MNYDSFYREDKMLSNRQDKPINLFAYRGSILQKRQDARHAHIEGYHHLIKYLVYLVSLRRKGEIDNDVFEELVKRASAAFVESELSERIDRILEEKISPERLMSLF